MVPPSALPQPCLQILLHAFLVAVLLHQDPTASSIPTLSFLLGRPTRRRLLLISRLHHAYDRRRGLTLRGCYRA